MDKDAKYIVCIIVIYTIEYYSAIKKSNNAIFSYMDGHTLKNEFSKK